MSISTVLRQAVSVEISLSNPLNEELRFLVSLQVGEAALVITVLLHDTRLPLHTSGHAEVSPRRPYSPNVVYCTICFSPPLPSCLLCPPPPASNRG